MAKEILFYNYGIGADTAQVFIKELEEAKADDVTVRINSPGGNPFFGWGAIAKFKEHEGKKKIKVDGAAQSMAAYMILFGEDVEALDVSNILFHRASMNIYSDEDKRFLDSINANLRKKLEAKVDAAKWKEVTGVSIKDMFESENLIDVSLNAKQAKQLGIINKIVTLKPNELTALNEKFSGVAAKVDPDKEKENQNPIKMTKEELKSKHPDVYASIVKEGIEAEQDRAGAWMAFVDIDPEAVKKGIDEGKSLSQKQMAEFSRKAMSAAALTDLEKEGAPKAETEEVKDKDGKKTEATKKEAEVNAFQKEVFQKLGIKTAEAVK